MKLNKKNIPAFEIAILLVLLIVGCQKEIVIPQKPYEGKVSIQGFVEPDSLPIVYYNRTVPYLTGSTNTTDLVIRNAQVTISSSTDSQILTLDSVNNKLDCRYDYFYKGNVPIKTNTTYTLQIIDGDKTYSAQASTKLKAVTIDSVSYTPAFKDLYGEHEGVIVYFNDIVGVDNYYRYEMYRKVDSTVLRGEKTLYGSCLAADTIMFRELGRSVYSDKNLADQQIKMVIEPALSHAEGVEGLVSVQSIDKAMYDFYDQVDRQKLGIQNPFVEPVYLEDGQFGKDVFGFFGARIRSKQVKFVYPE